LNRRRFLKYAGTTAAVVGASALGLDYLLKPQSGSQNQTATSSVTTTSPTPPSISNFQWQPTRIVNGKVYDATLSFQLQAESPGADVSGTIDAYAPTIPPRAYPAEPPRNLQFNQPTASGTRSTQIADLKGGKYYQATVKVRDSAGKDANAQFQTPYVREFENLAKDTKLRIGAYYYPWYRVDGWEPNTNHVEPPKGSPLLGYYDSSDDIVISKHIDWATGHGISSWTSSWEGIGATGGNTNRLFNNSLSDEMEIGVYYESTSRLKVDETNPTEETIDLSDNENLNTLISDTRSFASNLFLYPNYQKLNGRPILSFYFSRTFVGDVEHAIGSVRDAAQDFGFRLFIIGDELEWWNNPNKTPTERLRLYDAITAYVLPGNLADWYNTDYETAMDIMLSQWFRRAQSVGVGFVPVATTGVLINHVPQSSLIKSVGKFVKRLQIAKKYVDPKLKTLMICTFNEWFEDTFVEPSIEDGFQYLEAIRDTLATTG